MPLFVKKKHVIDKPLICPSRIFTELELPNGSSWPDVIADFLDFIEGQKVGYTLTKHKMELGELHTFEKPPIESKIINKLNVLSEFIANEEISI